MAPPLVICVGNPARGDDGVAHRVAALLEGRDDLDVVALSQLDVTLAEDVAAREVAIVVDAARRAFPAVSVERVEASAVRTSSGHELDCGMLLALAEDLYGGRPELWLVGVAAPEMEHSWELSDTAEAASVEAASAVLVILGLPER